MARARGAGRKIGRWGTSARLLTGTAMLAGAILVGIDAIELLLGLVVLPSAVVLVAAIRGRAASRIRLTGPEGHCVNCGVIAVVVILSPVAAMLFYGSSMLIAAFRGYGGCEVFAASNWLWRRDDQIACPIFHMIDRREAGLGKPRHGRETVSEDCRVGLCH